MLAENIRKRMIGKKSLGNTGQNKNGEKKGDS